MAIGRYTFASDSTNDSSLLLRRNFSWNVQRNVRLTGRMVPREEPYGSNRNANCESNGRDAYSDNNRSHFSCSVHEILRTQLERGTRMFLASHEQSNARH